MTSRARIGVAEMFEKETEGVSGHDDDVGLSVMEDVEMVDTRLSHNEDLLTIPVAPPSDASVLPTPGPDRWERFAVGLCLEDDRVCE